MLRLVKEGILSIYITLKHQTWLSLHFLTSSSDAINLPASADLRISLRALDKFG